LISRRSERAKLAGSLIATFSVTEAVVSAAAVAI
jgi:hypothetical protein